MGKSCLKRARALVLLANVLSGQWFVQSRDHKGDGRERLGGANLTLSWDEVIAAYMDSSYGRCRLFTHQNNAARAQRIVAFLRERVPVARVTEDDIRTYLAFRSRDVSKKRLNWTSPGNSWTIPWAAACSARSHGTFLDAFGQRIGEDGPGDHPVIDAPALVRGGDHLPSWTPKGVGGWLPVWCRTTSRRPRRAAPWFLASRPPGQTYGPLHRVATRMPATLPSRVSTGEPDIPRRASSSR